MQQTLTKQKGNTNVKEKLSATILYTTRIVDVGKAKVARSGQADWDDFEIMGTSNKAEGEYKNRVLTDPEKSHKVLEQLRKSGVRQRVMRMAASLVTNSA